MDYKKIYESKNATITLDSFYSENERMTKEPFPFPITVLLNKGDGYEQTYADTNYSLIEITNVTEKNFPGVIYNPENFNQHAWSSVETDAVYNPEDFVFYFDKNVVHGYKELVKVIKKKNPNLDIKPDPYWMKPVKFRVEIGGSMDYDYFFNMNNPFDLSIVCDNFKCSKTFRGVYVAIVSHDIRKILYNKFKLPVIKNGGPILPKKKDDSGPKHFNLGRITNESAGQKDFIEQIDGGWGNILTNIYEEANNKHLLLQTQIRTEEFKLFSRTFGFTNIEEDGKLAFYITDEDLQDVLKNYTISQEFFLEDKDIRIEIPMSKVIIELNGIGMDLDISDDDSLNPVYDIKVKENGDIIYFKVFDLAIGRRTAVVDYQANCVSFLYDINLPNTLVNKFITIFNKDIFKNINYDYEE